MLDGTIRTLGLADLFKNAHQVRDIFGDTPLETASLIRLFLAIVHRARNGPSDASAWAAIWQFGGFGKPETEYLERWQHRFNLYDSERPFYQFVPEKEFNPISIAKPQPDRASGGNGTLYDWSLDSDPTPVSAAKAARIVVASQAFSLGEAHGFKHGQCARGDVHIIEGRSLFETLLLNLLPYNRESPVPNTLDDRPAWEQDDPFSPDREIPYGWLDLLTFQARRMILLPESDGSVRWMYWQPGLASDITLHDPMMRYVYRPSTKSYYPKKTTKDADAQWLDMNRVAANLPDQSIPVMTVEWVLQLVREGWLLDYAKQTPMRLGVYSIVSNQSRIDHLLHENLPFPVLDIAGEQSMYFKAIQMAAVAGQILQTTFIKTKVAESGNLDNAKKSAPRVSRQFWFAVYPQIESMFGHNSPVSDEELADWQDTLRKQAIKIYQTNTNPTTSRAYRAYGENIGLLGALLTKYLRDPEAWRQNRKADDEPANEDEGEEDDNQ